MPRRRPRRNPALNKDALAPVLLDLLIRRTAGVDALAQNRAAQARLAELSMAAADARWPGFRRLVERLMIQEAALARKVPTS